MAEASNIGANFSDYQGNAGLGGFGLGFGKIDTRPLEDLAKYTMLYNRAEWEKRQKEQEDAAKEMAKFAGLNLATTIPKDAKILQEKFDKTIQYIRENPDALNYSKNKEKWLEYNKMKADLENDIRFGATRSLMNVARKEKIASVTNEKQKAFLEEQLQKNIDATDIRTPLDHDQKYDVKPLDFGENKGVVFDVTKEGRNQIFQQEIALFDIPEAKRSGTSAALTGHRDLDSVTGQLGALADAENPWVQLSGTLNAAIVKAKDDNGNVDIKKLSGVPGIKNIQDYEDYKKTVRGYIESGFLSDKLDGNRVTFGSPSGGLKIEDYEAVDLNNGVPAEYLAEVAQFSKWAGDQRNTKVIQTNDEIERQRLAATWKGLGLEEERMNKGKTQDWISATSAIREAADVLEGGTPVELVTGNETVVKDSKGRIIGTPKQNILGRRTVMQISDPNLMKEFGTIDKDGTVTNVPNSVFWDKAANKLQLIYYKKDENGQILTGGKGEPVIDNKIDLTGTQWIGQIVRRKNPNSDIGGVNAYVEQFFNAPEVGRKLENLKLIYGQVVEGTNKKSETESKSTKKPATTPNTTNKWSQYEEK